MQRRAAHRYRCSLPFGMRRIAGLYIDAPAQLLQHVTDYEEANSGSVAARRERHGSTLQPLGCRGWQAWSGVMDDKSDHAFHQRSGRRLCAPNIRCRRRAPGCMLPTHERFDLNPDVTRACVAHGVFDEVPQDLRDANGVGADRDRRRREFDLKGEVLRMGCVLKAGTDILNQLAELESLNLRW